MKTEAEFKDCPELIDALKSRLHDWGWHYRGDVDLGYPKQAAGMHSSVARPAPYVPTHSWRDAQRVERLVTSSSQASLAGLRNALVLRTEFVRRDLPKSEKARRFGISIRTYYRRLDGALFWFYSLTQTLEDAIDV